LQGGLTDATFQIVLQKLPFQRGGRGLEFSGGVQRVALFSMKCDQRSYGALDLLTHCGDVGDAPEQIIMRIQFQSGGHAGCIANRRPFDIVQVNL
jgi:hypothetical protein